MLANDSQIDNVLSAALIGDTERNVPGDVDVWPRVQAKLAGNGRRRARRLALLVVAATLALSASIALADSPPVRLILTAVDPARIRFGALPEDSARMSLAEAEQKAGVTAFRAPENNGVRLIGVELVAPVTEILGRPVVDPQPRIRLTYDVRGVRAIVEEQRNPRPGEAMLIVPIGPPHGRLETEGSIERYYIYNQNGDGVDAVVWGTPELWINVRFQPALDAGQARLFVRSLR
jgi:hypothetical protein